MTSDDAAAEVDPAATEPAEARGTSIKDEVTRPPDEPQDHVVEAEASAGSAMHGQHYQLTTRLPPKVVAQIREWAATLEMSQQDLQRYCFYRGLQALAEGERPEFAEVVVRRRLKLPQ